MPFEDARARARATYVELVRGDPVGVNAQMRMLFVLDALMSPEFEHTAIPTELRDDEALLGSLQDEVADVIAKLFAEAPPPIGALEAYGPISGRVHQKLESMLFDAFARSSDRIVERGKQELRDDATIEWLEVSHARMAFRRIEHAFGTAAAAQVWPRHAHAYTTLGVLLAETHPRRRPLAHAVFKSVRDDAERFGDEANMSLHERNVSVTCGFE
jgi:hypothetical protein